MSRFRTVTSLSLVVSLLVLVAPDALAQQRRRAGPPGEVPPPSGPVRQRQPYVGSWQGMLTLGTSTATADAPTPLSVTFDIADTTTGDYTGTTIVGEEGRSQNLRAVAGDGVIRWEATGADSIVHVYTARLVATDSIVGSVARREASGNAKPAGTFVLVRRGTPPRRAGG